MIHPVQQIYARMNLPRKQHAIMRIDYDKHTIICANGQEVTLPAKEAWKLLEEIKNGRIYDESV